MTSAPSESTSLRTISPILPPNIIDSFVQVELYGDSENESIGFEKKIIGTNSISNYLLLKVFIMFIGGY
ncbi:MAG: hypothetical protein WC121_06075 [Candidatus Kapaibacterium sp.]